MLRSDPDWEELRRVLRRRHVRIKDTLLAAFVEDANRNEYGALVTGDGQVIEYHRLIGLPRRRPKILLWADRTGDLAITEKYPQLAAAMEIHRQIGRPVTPRQRREAQQRICREWKL